MDPDEALDEQRDVADLLRSTIDAGSDDEDLGFGSEDDLERTDRLVDLVKAQDAWIMNGSSLPREWALRCNGGLLKRAEIARRVYEEALAATETFEGDFGVQLAYLFGAILANTKITLHLDVTEEAEVLDFFQTIFNKSHPVWDFINAESPVAAAS